MTWNKHTSNSTKLVMALALRLGIIVLVGVQLISPVQSQSSLSSLSNQLPSQWEATSGTFQPPQRGNPDNRQGGGTRSPFQNCIQGNKGLVALVPTSGVNSTVAAYPTFFWYLPTNSASALEFVLQDEKGQEVYLTKFTLTKSARGFMSLQLPALAGLSPLEKNTIYHWYVSLICNPEERAADRLVEGFISRVDLNPNVASQSQRATPQERVAIYAEARLWQDTLNSLAELRRLNPQDPSLVDAWKKLLGSVGLEAIAEEPLI